MQKTHAVALLLTALTGPPGSAAAQIPASAPSPVLRLAGDTVVLAMPIKGGRHMVQLTIGSEGPFDFVIDTGSSPSVIDARLAARLGLAATGTVAIGAPGGGTVDAGVVRAPVLRAGGLEIQGATALTIELAELTGGLMQGILGMDLFREVLLTLDPARNRAIVSRGRLTPGEAGVVGLSSNRGNLEFEIDVAGQRVAAHIDTGAPGTFTLPQSAMEDLPLIGPEQRSSAGLVGSTREARIRQLDGAIQFAGLRFERPSVAFMSLPVANIGSQVLDQLVTRIDQANGLIAFTAASEASAPVQASATPRRLGLRLGGPGGNLSKVGGVDAGSLSERAGLRAGDTIRLLNGRAMSTYEPAALGTLLRGTDPLTFEVERDGRRVVVTIP